MTAHERVAPMNTDFNLTFFGIVRLTRVAYNLIGIGGELDQFEERPIRSLYRQCDGEQKAVIRRNFSDRLSHCFGEETAVKGTMELGETERTTPMNTEHTITYFGFFRSTRIAYKLIGLGGALSETETITIRNLYRQCDEEQKAVIRRNFSDRLSHCFEEKDEK